MPIHAQEKGTWPQSSLAEKPSRNPLSIRMGTLGREGAEVTSSVKPFVTFISA